MLGTRWIVAIKDLWRNWGRSSLAVLSIAVGVIAVGAISTSTAVIRRNMDAQYLATCPADLVVWTSTLDDDAIAAVERLPSVAAAEGKASFRAEVQVGPDSWKPVYLYAIDPQQEEIGRITVLSGEAPPKQRRVLLERRTLGYLGVAPGDTVTVRAFGELERELHVDGVVHNLGLPPPLFNDGGSGYISMDTRAWFGLPPTYSEVHVRVTDELRNTDGLQAAAKAITTRIEKGGGSVWGYWAPTPGRHWASDILDPVMLIMQVLGVAALGLAAFLVVNTIVAILAQQRRSVGMLKAIGARRRQIVALYLGMVLVLGVLALLVATPVKTWLAHGIADYVADMLNFDISDYRPPLQTVLLEAAAALLAPLLAALAPILRGTSITVREAINDYGLTDVAPSSGIAERLTRLKALSRTFALGLRNTFRRRGRLVLTLTTLVMGGAVFVSVLNVRASLGRTTDEALQYWNHELTLSFGQPLRIGKVDNELTVVPGVAAVEYWGLGGAERVLANGGHGEPFMIVAPPADTRMITPTMIAGRWLLPEDENALVINSDLLKADPTLQVGQTVTLQLDRNGSKIETEWVVVGVVKALMVGPLGYANYPYLAHTVGQVGRAYSARIQLTDRSPANQEAMGKLLAAHLRQRGITVNSWESTAEVRERIMGQLNTVVGILLTMSVLFAAVGGLGLMGTLSINVLERRRELGVMRAIGASSRVVRRIVITEGLCMALISWGLGGLVALPMSALLGSALGTAMIRSPLTQVYSFGGQMLWLLIVMGIGAAASVLPAQRAVGVTVREVLAYD